MNLVVLETMIDTYPGVHITGLLPEPFVALKDKLREGSGASDGKVPRIRKLMRRVRPER